MKLNCINCGERIPVNHVNIEKAIAICPACGEVFNFADQIPVRKSKKLAQPVGVMIQEQPDGVLFRIEQTAHTQKKSTLLAIAALFTVIGAGFLLLAVMAMGGFFSIAAWGRVLLALSPLWIPIALCVYYLLATALNHKEITLDENRFQFKQMPFPLPFTKRHLDRFQIVDVEMREYSNDTPQKIYSVYVTLKDGSGFVLLNQLKHDHAEYIAQELMEYLYSEGEVEDIEDESEVNRIEEAAQMRLQKR